MDRHEPDACLLDMLPPEVYGVIALHATSWGRHALRCASKLLRDQVPGGADRHLNIVMPQEDDDIAMAARSVTRRVRCEGACMASMRISCNTADDATALAQCLPDRWGHTLTSLRVHFGEMQIDPLVPLIAECTALKNLTLRTTYGRVSSDAWNDTLSSLPATLVSLHMALFETEDKLNVGTLSRLLRLERLVLDLDESTDDTSMTGIDEALRGLRSLRELSLLRCATTAADLPAIMSASSTSLESLELGPVYDYEDEESIEQFAEAAKHLRSLKLHDPDSTVPCYMLEAALRRMTRLTAFGCGMSFSADHLDGMGFDAGRVASLRSSLMGILRLDLSTVLRTAPREVTAVLGRCNRLCHIVIGPVSIADAASAQEIRVMSAFLERHPGGFSHRVHRMTDGSSVDRMLCLYASDKKNWCFELTEEGVADALAALLPALRGLHLTWHPAWLDGERSMGKLLGVMRPGLTGLRVLATQTLCIDAGREMHLLPQFARVAADMDGVRDIWFTRMSGRTRGHINEVELAAFSMRWMHFDDYLDALTKTDEDKDKDIRIRIRIDAVAHSPMWLQVHDWYASAAPHRRRHVVELNVVDDDSGDA